MPAAIDGHIGKRYDEEITELRNLILQMGGLVEDQIDRAVQALEQGDLKLAEEVIERDRRVNRLELQVDRQIVTVLGRRQPLAVDLRLIVSTAKAVTDLERIGDEAEKIARMTVYAYDREGMSFDEILLRDVRVISKMALAMVKDALDAFARLDVDMALAVTRADDELDAQFESALRRLMDCMLDDPGRLGHAIDVLFVIKALERIGDHAKNVGQYVIFLVEGTDVRHLSDDVSVEDLVKRDQRG